MSGGRACGTTHLEHGFSRTEKMMLRCIRERERSQSEASYNLYSASHIP